MRDTDKLTAKNFKTIQIDDGKDERLVWNEDVAGFGLRLRKGGSRTWIYQYRIGKTQYRMGLGSAKSVPFKLARDNAALLEAQVTVGGNPAVDRKAAHDEAANTFGALVKQYLEAEKSRWRPRSEAEVKRHLNKHAKQLHSKSIGVVSQRDIAELLNKLAANAGDVTANRVRASLCAFFSWVIGEGIRLPEGNVASYTNKREEKSRDRVLSDAELKTIWKACDDDDYGAVLKLLMLTGQRANEIAELRHEEIRDEQIVLPAERTKNGRTHLVPLSDAAISVLPKTSKDRTHVFGRDDTGFQGWSKAKERIDGRIADAGQKLAHWTPHDLRRTAVTRMADLGVQPHIIEAVVNHVSGHKGGVAGIYNRATYDKEKREALNLWAEHLTAVVEGRKATVVPLKRA